MNGYKTYLVSALLVGYALLGFYLGQLEAQQALLIIFNALGLSALRHGISTQNKVE